MKHSVSNYKPAISSFNPQGTSKPSISRMGGAIGLAVGNKVGTPCKCAQSETTSFGRARYEIQHGGGSMGDD
jgi:hypothetical protein